MLLAFLNVSSGCESGNELHHAAFLEEEVFLETACDMSLRSEEETWRLRVLLSRKALCDWVNMCSHYVGKVSI